MRRHDTLRIQKPVKGGRRRVSAAMHKTLRIALEDAKHRTGASMSFITAVAVAKFLGVKNQEWL